MIIIKPATRQYRYPFAVVFLLIVEFMWLAPAMAVDSASKTLQQNITPKDKGDNNNSLFDSGAPPKTNISITSNLYFGSRFDLEFETEKNFNLDTNDAEDIAVLEPALPLAFFYTPSRNFSVFLNVEPSQTHVVDQDNKKKDKARLEVIQAYLSFKKVIGELDIKVGRQRFKDTREWLYDEELDGIRLSYNFPGAAIEFSVSKKKHKDLINEGNDEKVTNYVFYGRYALNKRTNVAAYIFARDDSTTAREDPVFSGLQLNGKHKFSFDEKRRDKLKYWLEWAHVEGESGADKISASGYDIGSAYRFGYSLKPAVTFGYAYGSGDDDPSDTIDRNFRQTGLQDNDAKFNGIVRMKYYGEMFDPELSNLAVYTAGLGIWPGQRISVDLVYHSYRQAKLSNKIRDSNIDQDPNGLSRELGHEVDFAVGYRGKKRRSKISLILGHFTPGPAFPNASRARFLEIKFRQNF